MGLAQTSKKSGKKSFHQLVLHACHKMVNIRSALQNIVFSGTENTTKGAFVNFAAVRPRNL